MDFTQVDTLVNNEIKFHIKMDFTVPIIWLFSLGPWRGIKTSRHSTVKHIGFLLLAFEWILTNSSVNTTVCLSTSSPVMRRQHCCSASIKWAVCCSWGFRVNVPGEYYLHKTLAIRDPFCSTRPLSLCYEAFTLKSKTLPCLTVFNR